MNSFKRYLFHSFLICILLFLIPSVAALSAEIDIPLSFYEGETIHFNYAIRSEFSGKVMFIPKISCPHLDVGNYEIKTIDLIAGQGYLGSFYDKTIDSSVVSQNCTAEIQIISPVKKTFSEVFSIRSDSLSFSIDIQLDKKVYIINENIEVGYASSIQDSNIQTTLIYPDKTYERVTLPASIQATQIGTYELEAIGSKEGYETVTIKEQFAIIEKEAEIVQVSFCEIDGDCEGDEDEQNCPQDCLDKWNPMYLYVSIIILLLIIIISYKFFIKRNQRMNDPIGTEPGGIDINGKK